MYIKRKYIKFRLALPVSILKCTVKQKMYFTTLVYTVNQNIKRNNFVNLFRN